jgi:protein gp37
MNETPDIQYGRLLESADLSTHAAQRAFGWMRGLLESGDWKEVGPGFEDVSTFVRSVPFGALNPPAELRKAYEATASEHGASNRAIADSAGVSEATVRRDLAPATDDAPAATPIVDDQRGPTPDNEAPATDDAPDVELPGMPARQGVADEILAELDAAAESFVVPEPEELAPKSSPVMLTLLTHTGDPVEYPQPRSKATFNQTDGEGISWAAWSWNPVTGCLHGCDYCYARAIAHRFTDGFPAGFTPLFHHERLDAPANTSIPAAHRDDPAWRRVFVCSMADLYGRWVPDEWIKQVHESMLASPAWEYLLLTKFPARYVGLDMPAGTWLGTSVDEQKRVRIAEDAFRQIDGVKVRWLSLEPLREPLEFSDLSMFDWVVIGAQTETRQPDGTVEAFMPPWEWVCRITAQAKEAGCRVHWKPNLLNGHPGLPLNEYPAS